jgi:sulfate/thiosulfate transport system substrate-binding protein
LRKSKIVAGGAAAAALVLSIASLNAQNNNVTLTLVGYSAPREAYAEIIPLFQAYWLAESGQTVNIDESYAASGTQSRAVVGGLPADIVVLGLEGHVKAIADSGLITHDWQDNGYGGFVATSVAAIIVREGNPLNITDWADLTAEGVEVLTPDAGVSAGARWNVLGGYGAALRGNVEGYSGDAEGGRAFLTDLFANVSVLSPDARESVLTFESGIGDAALSYESEYFALIEESPEYEIVYPSSTIQIDLPIALVDENVDRNGTRDVAQAFIDFLYTPEVQAIYAAHGFRPPVPTSDEFPAFELDSTIYPELTDVFTTADLGGWSEITPAVFGDEGVYTQVLAEVQGS